MHGHHTDIFVYCLYDTVLKYFDFGKRVLSEERQTRPAHSCGQFQVFPCHTPLDQTHPPCCMFRFVGESLISSGDDSLWRLMQHPFQYTMMHKKAYRELPIYIYHFSEIAAICSDFMFFVHHSFEMLWGHQENNTTQLDLVQKARAGKMQIFLQAVITISPYIHCIYTETKKTNMVPTTATRLTPLPPAGCMAPLPLPGPESMTWRQPRMIVPHIVPVTVLAESVHNI